MLPEEPSPRSGPAPEKQESFVKWKRRDGAKFEAEFEQAKTSLKTKRQELKDMHNQVNERKKQIDTAKDAVIKKQREKDARDTEDEATMIDSEEYELMLTLKNMKTSYREAYEAHRELKMETVHLEHAIQATKTNLVQSFEEWYDKKYGHLLKKGEEEDIGETRDAQEQFDLLEAERLEQEHPDALAFYKARKTATRHTRGKAAGAGQAARGR